MRKVLYILGQLDDADIAWMAGAGRATSIAAGTRLIEEGRHSDYMFIVLDGLVTVDVAGVGTVARLGAGEVIGEMSFVDKAPPAATVSAATSARVFALDKARVEDRLADNPAFAARFYKALAVFLSDRLRKTMAGATGKGTDAQSEDELDEAVLDGVSIAGVRFRQFLTTLEGSAS